MPHIKTDEERGYEGAWMRRERLARDWSPARVCEELRAAGYPIRDVDYYRQIEARTNGKRPSAEMLEALVRIYGSRPEPLPEPEPPATSGDVSALLADMQRQTLALEAVATALGELVIELRASQEDAMERRVREAVRNALAHPEHNPAAADPAAARRNP